MALGLGLSGCAPTEEATDDTPSPAPQRAPGPDLASDADDVKTVQLYRDGNEQSLPVMSLQNGEPLRLEFDVLGREGRPLSIQFLHADRTWREDLAPSQYMESFQNDNLLEYRPSIGTEVAYVHYSYQFPNGDIRFRVSGNYILRVTEQGRPDAVLFERAFFIAEGAGGVQLQTEGVVVSGQRSRSVRPIALYTPPASLRGETFGYSTCFVRNGRLDEVRCEDRPLLAQRPALGFELDRARAFAPTTADFVLDLADLRVGGDIERVDRLTSPFEVLLEPDFARFSGDALAPTLQGQILVESVVRNRTDPNRSADYANVTFALVPPDERPLRGPVRIAGSFTGMRLDPDLTMRWVTERGRYEGTVLLKQGRYEYFYHADDPRLQQVLRQSLPQSSNRYAAFVYYEDVSLNTDRLLAVSAVSR